jgi:alpha 1,2-mannosyltransferase
VCDSGGFSDALAITAFAAAHPEYLEPDNALSFISDDGGRSWNTARTCPASLISLLFLYFNLPWRLHPDFWSNFEIGSLDFFRSEAYSAYFDHLDQAGGFFYERWGDAPVHSIAACLFLKPEEM